MKTYYLKTETSKLKVGDKIRIRTKSGWCSCLVTNINYNVLHVKNQNDETKTWFKSYNLKDVLEVWVAQKPNYDIGL